MKLQLLTTGSTKYALALFALGFISPLAAQPAAYNYDPPGNTTSVHLGGSGAPSILAQPATQLLRTNGVVTFSVSASGSGLSYQWLSNGVSIAGATGDSLILTNLAGTNFASYTVRVSNSSGAVTSAPPATVWLDANVNGLPDWWELQYFGNLNQKPGADFDADGVTNLDEYREGTHPANKNSFNPRLLVQAAHGSVLVNPNLPYYAPGEFVSVTAVPNPGWTFLEWSGDTAGTKSQVNLLMDTNKVVTAHFGLALPVALNHFGNWTTGGDAQWFGQAEVSHDNSGAAQSGPIWSGTAGNFVGQQTWLQIVTNSAHALEVSFWWAVSCQPPDALTFSVGGVPYATISGELLHWQFFTTSLPPGNHTLTWTYAKGPTDLPTGIPFLDSAWLDQVSVVPVGAEQPPALTISLTSSNTVLLSWPAPSTGFFLEQNDEVATTNWINSTAPVNIVGTDHHAIVPRTNAARFYRLNSL
jgi:hypothetical protein